MKLQRPPQKHDQVAVGFYLGQPKVYGKSSNWQPLPIAAVGPTSRVRELEKLPWASEPALH
jgi:hypothetical protein